MPISADMEALGGSGIHGYGLKRAVVVLQGTDGCKPTSSLVESFVLLSG